MRERKPLFSRSWIYSETIAGTVATMAAGMVYLKTGQAAAHSEPITDIDSTLRILGFGSHAIICDEVGILSNRQISSVNRCRGTLGSIIARIVMVAGLGVLAGCNGSSNNTIIIKSTPTPLPTSTPTLLPTSTPASTTPTVTPTAIPSSTPTPTPTPSPTPTPMPVAATNSSIIAVDCVTQRAYVPLPDLNPDLDGEVAVLDLSVDPDKHDPRLTTIDLGDTFLPRAAAVDITKGLVVVVSDNVLNTGHLEVIPESDNKPGAPILFPTGSRPNETDGVVFDAEKGTGLVSMTDSFDDCTGFPGSCTGMAVFDLATQSFGPFFQLLSPVDNFAFDTVTQTALGSSDTVSPTLLAVDVTNKLSCSLSDANVDRLDSDPDGMAVDPTTNIWVAGNFDSSTASVLNLAGSSFTHPPACTLVEGGTPPNSVNHDTGASDGMPGVAVNPLTHQALMTAASSNQVALLSLPPSPVVQLTAAMIASVHGAVPNTPEGDPFLPAEFPYATVVDTCHNLGYVLSQDRTFLVQIDLAQFQSNPTSISKPLPSGGSCAGTTTPFKCSSGSGVKFFPLPGVP